MGDLTYHYISNKNQLGHVTDAVSASNYTVDIDNQSANNYSYDAIGNLVADNAEGLTNITWNVYGKLSTITKSGSVIRYIYDASGNRIMKYTSTDTTVYVRDASGNVMSVYSRPAGGVLSQSETHLYGSSRLGMATRHVSPDTSLVIPWFWQRTKSYIYKR